MKRVMSACVGGRNFTMDDDAYNRLDAYLRNFRAKLTVPESQKGEVMDDIESRIAELFYAEVGDGARVVTLPMVERVVSTLGMPDGSAETGYSYSKAFPEDKVQKKLYRDMDNKGVAGVCSGLAWYFDIDVTLIRIIMLVALFAGTSGFWIYVILWIAVPKALTPAQQCEMRGIPATAENMSRFTNHAQDTYNR